MKDEVYKDASCLDLALKTARGAAWHTSRENIENINNAYVFINIIYRFSKSCFSYRKKERYAVKKSWKKFAKKWECSRDEVIHLK